MAVGSHSRSAFNAAAMYAYAERKVINAGPGGRSRSSTINQIKGWKREIKLAPVEKSGSTVVLASSSRSLREGERVKNDEHDLSVSRRSRELDTALGERRDRSGVVRRREADRPEKIHGVPL